MKRIAYRLWVDFPDETDLNKAREIVQDALEGVHAHGVLAVEYTEIGHAEGLPARGEVSIGFPSGPGNVAT